MTALETIGVLATALASGLALVGLVFALERLTR